MHPLLHTHDATPLPLVVYTYMHTRTYTYLNEPLTAHARRNAIALGLVRVLRARKARIKLRRGKPIAHIRRPTNIPLFYVRIIGKMSLIKLTSGQIDPLDRRVFDQC